MQYGFEGAVSGVRVECGSRLHLGFTNLSPELGRCYGSIGVGLEIPRIVYTLRPSDDLQIEAERPDQVLQYIDRFCRHFGVEPRVRVCEQERIPEHAGLGSGTRVALALGLGLSSLFGVSTDVAGIAGAMGRGRRSSVGILTFAVGGLVVDAGQRPGRPTIQRPQAIFRHAFPAEWRFVVCIPEWEEGLSGHAEEGVFQVLEPPRAVSERICCTTHLALLPALLEEDIHAVGRALTEIDRAMGSFFEQAQDGVTAQTAGGRVIERMLESGATGGGQSSWGPAVYGLVHHDDAGRVEESVQKLLDELGLSGLLLVCKGRNTGAGISFESERLPQEAADRSVHAPRARAASRGRPW